MLWPSGGSEQPCYFSREVESLARLLPSSSSSSVGGPGEGLGKMNVVEFDGLSRHSHRVGLSVVLPPVVVLGGVKKNTLFTECRTDSLCTSSLCAEQHHSCVISIFCNGLR